MCTCTLTCVYIHAQDITYKYIYVTYVYIYICITTETYFKNIVRQTGCHGKRLKAKLSRLHILAFEIRS